MTTKVAEISRMTERLTERNVQGRCDHGEVLTATCDDCRTATTQPLPDTGEWHVDEHGPHRGRVMIRDEKGRFAIYCLYGTFEQNKPIDVREAQRKAAQIVAEHNTAGKLVAALELAAQRIDFLTNWIENTYGGSNQDVALGRQYAAVARLAAKERQ